MDSSHEQGERMACMVPQAWRFVVRRIDASMAIQIDTLALTGQKNRPGPLRERPGPLSGRSYLAKPQKTSRIIPSSFSVRVSPTR